jgi:hypothetical protein
MATSRHQSHRTSNTLVVNVVLNRSCDAIQPFGRETDGFGFNEFVIDYRVEALEKPPLD